MAIFTLTGPNKGKSGDFGGFEFKNGSCEVVDTEAEKASRILCRYYSAELNAKKAPTKKAPVKKSTSKKSEA